MKKLLIGKRRKRDNRGMTLVEVLVAMAILAVVIVPTLQIFSSSSRTNLRSRRQQRAIVIAEGTMESFKAYTMADLVEQFQNGNFAGAPSPTSMEVKAYNGADEIAAADVWVETAARYAAADNSLVVRERGVLNTQATEYKFKVSGAQLESGRYDIYVDVTPQMKSNVLKMDNMNKYKNAMIGLEKNLNAVVHGEDPTVTAPRALLTAMLDAAKKDLCAHGDFSAFGGVRGGTAEIDSNVFVNDSDIKFENIRRSIAVVADDDLVRDYVTVEVTYTFDATIRAYEYDDPSGTRRQSASMVGAHNCTDLQVDCMPQENGVSAVWDAYDNTHTVGNGYLEEIYICYTPDYARALESNLDNVDDIVTDEISIVNNINRKLTVSVVKQFDDSYRTNIGQLDTLDGSYGGKFTLVGSSTGADGGMKLRTNLMDNVVTGVAASVTNTYRDARTQIDGGTISGFTDVKRLSDPADPADTIKTSDTLLKEKVLLYNVTIEVRDAGDLVTAAPLVTLSGTVND